MNDPVLMKKLQLKDGLAALVLKPPAGYLDRLADAAPVTSPTGRYDFIQLFVADSQELAVAWTQASKALKAEGLLWICYPKLSSGIKSDLNRDAGWEIVFQAGYRPVTQIAIDKTWSALRFKPVLHESPQDAVEAQFSGSKASLRPIYEHILATALSFGEDIQVNPRQSYIALARKKQFAIIKASTSARLDLGLRLVNPVQTPRLEPAEGFGSSSINYKVSLNNLAQVDAELLGWLRSAYEGAG